MKIELDIKYVKTLLFFLDDLLEHQGNSGCNDLPQNIQKIWTKEEGEQVAEEYGQYNDPGVTTSWPLMDFELLDFIKHKIKTQIQETKLCSYCEGSGKNKEGDCCVCNGTGHEITLEKRILGNL
jgi:DnaJ-class molecular chaperone